MLEIFSGKVEHFANNNDYEERDSQTILVLCYK